MFRFIRFQECHLGLFKAWLQEPHVNRYWKETADEAKLRAKLLADPAISNAYRFIVEESGVAIGYIQYWEAAKTGDECWTREPPGVFGVDIFIGSIDRVGVGLGPKIIEAFIDFLRSQEPHAHSIIIDPQPENKFAISAYAKAGFLPEKEISTPDGPALLMRRKLAD